MRTSVGAGLGPAAVAGLGPAAVALAIAALVVVVAATAAVVDAEGARRALGFTFEGVPREPGEALSILANNLRLAFAAVGACLVAHLLRPTLTSRALERVPARALVTICDATLALACVGHVLIAGVALGGYGGRMAAALLPHGPLELVAFSLVLSAYLRARRGGLAPRRLAATSGACASLLLAGAVAEVYL
jgi:hypothetical protein